MRRFLAIGSGKPLFSRREADSERKRGGASVPRRPAGNACRIYRPGPSRNGAMLRHRRRFAVADDSGKDSHRNAILTFAKLACFAVQQNKLKRCMLRVLAVMMGATQFLADQAVTFREVVSAFKLSKWQRCHREDAERCPSGSHFRHLYGVFGQEARSHPLSPKENSARLHSLGAVFRWPYS